MTDTQLEELKNYMPKLSLETPFKDYKEQLAKYIVVDYVVDDEILQENFRELSEAALKTVWQLLFATANEPSKEIQDKAAKLLEAHKKDACFYSPWEYNDWIIGFRNELLDRNYLYFWKEHVVAKELGPCWSRDSDLFDKAQNDTVEKFYRHAGCVAPFAKSID